MDRLFLHCGHGRIPHSVMTRLALGLEYNGAGFCGWQSQTMGVSVQDTLQSALARVANHAVSVSTAGRTDTGVHALMQVVHFDAEVVRTEQSWIQGVNAHLPPSIRILWAKPVPDDFHARFCAQARCYQYLLLNRSVNSAIWMQRAGWFHRKLDLHVMQQAAQYLVGSHDFSAFRASACQAKTAIKEIYRAEVQQYGDFYLFTFCANAFLYHQVRNMVGALIYVGKGKYPVDWMQTLLLSRARTLAPPTFAPDGLYLTGVQYHNRWGLPPTHRALARIFHHPLPQPKSTCIDVPARPAGCVPA